MGSISASAQDSGTPLKGDLNNDGKVDAADVVTLVNIITNGGETGGETKHYWYVGETMPTEENYKSIATEVTSYDDRYEFTPSSERTYVYVLVAADMSIAFIEPTLMAEIDIIELTDVNIAGHKVFRSGPKIYGLVYIDVGDEWKHYYLGTTKPTADNIETLTPLYKSFTEMNGETIQVPAGGKLYLLAPYCYSEPVNFNQLGRYAFFDSEGNNVTFSSSQGASLGRYFYSELTVDEEKTITFRYPYEEPAQTYWFSYGTEEITADNYTTANGATQVSSYPTETEWTPDSGRQYLYILVKNDKNVTITVPGVPGYTYTSEDTTTINGYKIVSTNGKIGGTIVINIL